MPVGNTLIHINKLIKVWRKWQIFAEDTFKCDLRNTNFGFWLKIHSYYFFLIGLFANEPILTPIHFWTSGDIFSFNHDMPRWLIQIIVCDQWSMSCFGAWQNIISELRSSCKCKMIEKNVVQYCSDSEYWFCFVFTLGDKSGWAFNKHATTCARSLSHQDSWNVLHIFHCFLSLP